MTKKNALELIKGLFSFSTETKEQKFEEVATLVEGNVTVYVEDEFVVGATLYVVTAEDQFVPAPMGEHLTTDGVSIIVDEASVITQINKPEVIEDVVVEENISDEDFAKILAQNFTSYNKIVTDKVNEISTNLKTVIAAKDVELKLLENKIESLGKKFQEFSDLPGGNRIVNNITPIAGSYSDRIQKIKEFKNNK